MTPPILGRLQVSTSLADGTAKRSLFLAFLIGCELNYANRQGILRVLSRSAGRDYPPGRVYDVLSSVTDL